MAQKNTKRKVSGKSGATDLRLKAKGLFAHAYKISKQDRHEDVIDFLRENSDLLQRFPTYHEMYGLSLYRLDRIMESIPYFRNAISKEPTALRYGYLANTYHILGDFEKAIEYHSSALRLDPKNWRAYYNFAFTLEDMRRFEEAVDALQIARKLKDDEPVILYQLGKYLLACGDVKLGSELLDAGLGCERRTPPPGIKGPYWTGQDVAGKRLVVWQEEGLGDEIRNSLYYQSLIDRGAELVIECRARLATLFQRNYPSAEIVPQDEPPSPYTRTAFDYHCGQNSLLQHCYPDVDQFPQDHGWLRPRDDLVAKWRSRFQEISGGKPVVGVSWTSSVVTAQRSMVLWPVTILKDILAHDEVTWVNLMYNASQDDVAALNAKLGSNIQHIADVDLKNDMENSFAYTKALDYIVTAPTSTMDIAGAIGAPGQTLYFARGPNMLGVDHFPQLKSIKVCARPIGQSWHAVAPAFTRMFRNWLHDHVQARAETSPSADQSPQQPAASS